MGNKIPAAYVMLEDIVRKPELATVMDRGTLFALAKPTRLSDEQLENALSFLNDIGVIFFSREVCQVCLDNVLTKCSAF